MAGAALVVAPATLSVGAAPAWADQPVVRAIVYSGHRAPQQTVTVTDAQLVAGCPAYGGASPFQLKPSGLPYQPAPGSSWSLGTVVTCGLKIPSGDLTAVQVQSPVHGGETALTAADLDDPSRYHDPTAPTALPVLSVDGGQDQVTYDRPWRGGNDPNGADQVVAPGPIMIVVYENAPPLRVQIIRTDIRSSSGAVRDRFTATATDQSGEIVPASSLSVAWTFGDGSGSGASAPTHRFAAAGNYFVTATVSDPAAGTGGTRTIAVAVDSKALAGDANRPGAGQNRRSSSHAGTVTERVAIHRARRARVVSGARTRR